MLTHWTEPSLREEQNANLRFATVPLAYGEGLKSCIARHMEREQSSYIPLPLIMPILGILVIFGII